MIVAHISKRLPYGLGAVIYNLCKYAKDFKPVVIATEYDNWDTMIRKLGVPFFLARNTGEFLKPLKHADIINLHCFDDDLRLYEFLKSFKIPIVLTLHFSIVFPKVYSSIICVSHWLKLIQRPVNKCVVIENAIDLDRFHPVNKRDEVDKVVLARICREKKCEDLFWPAVIEALNERNNIQLWLIGHRGMSTRQIKRFDFQEDISSILAKVDIVVHTPPLKSCGSDLVVQEVMAMGIPAIFADVECVRTSTSGKGDSILVKLDDTKGLKEKILLLADNPALRRKIGSAAVKTALKNFDAKVMAQKYEAVYRAIIQS